MKGLIGRRQSRKLKKLFAVYTRKIKEADTQIMVMMREMRQTGTNWRAEIEELECDDPAAAARLPAGTKEFCDTIIERSADAELAFGDTFNATLAVHEAIQSIEPKEHGAER